MRKPYIFSFNDAGGSQQHKVERPFLSTREKTGKLLEVLRTARGTALGLGFWWLLWTAGFLSSDPETVVVLLYFNFYVGLFQSMICLLLAIICRKWGIPLVFVAISPWIPLVLLNFVDQIRRLTEAYGISIKYPFSLLFFVLILVSTYLLCASFEYLLIKRSNRVIPRK